MSIGDDIFTHFGLGCEAQQTILARGFDMDRLFASVGRLGTC